MRPLVARFLYQTSVLCHGVALHRLKIEKARNIFSSARGYDILRVLIDTSIGESLITTSDNG